MATLPVHVALREPPTEPHSPSLSLQFLRPFVNLDGFVGEREAVRRALRLLLCADGQADVKGSDYFSGGDIRKAPTTMKVEP